MSEMIKTCARCGEEKQHSSFSKSAKAKDGLQSWCRQCFLNRARPQGATTLTVAELKDCLIYDENSGVFTRRRGKLAGKVAGSDHAGYIAIRVKGRQYLAHRLAWLYSYGEWPSREVDHIDRNPSNNRIANLRAATRAQNVQNSCVYRALPKGVSLARRHPGRWRVSILGQYFGTYDSPHDAALVYDLAAELAFGKFRGNLTSWFNAT